MLADDYYGEPGQSPLRYGADMVRFKPRCDVLFDAVARIPGARMTRTLKTSRSTRRAVARKCACAVFRENGEWHKILLFDEMEALLEAEENG